MRSPVVRARIGYFVGVLLLAAGFWLELGAGWALGIVGAGLITYMVLLYDVDGDAPYDAPEEVRIR